MANPVAEVFESHLTVEQRALLACTRELASSVLAPVAATGRPGRVNRPLVRALGEQGLLAKLYDPDHASREISAVELCLIREGLAQHCIEAETAFALQGLGFYPICQSGSPELVGEWLPAVAAGEAVAAFAMTEPNAGSDAGALQLRAERDQDGWRLNGVKTFISNAPEADIYAVFARTGPETGSRGVTAFAVPGDADGVGGQSLELIGGHAVGRLELDRVFVPDSYLLADVGRGFRVAMQTLDLFRPSVGAFAVGMAQAALDAAVAHANERRTFGRPLRAYQAVSHKLAEMATRTQAARLLVHSAASARDSGVSPNTLAASMAKLYATESAQFVVDSAMQIHGARSLEQGHLLERLYREVRAPRIYEGASEIQREIVARELLRPVAT